MRFLKTVLLMLALQAVLVLHSPGQNPPPAATGSPAATATPTPNIPAEILEVQLKVAKESADAQKWYNEKILGTVNTFVIAYVTVFGLISVGGVVSLFRRNSTQRQALRAEVEKKIGDLNTTVTEKLSALESVVETKIMKATTLALSNVDDVLRATFNRIAMLDHRMTADDATRFETSGDIAAALYSLTACVSSANTTDSPWLVQRDLAELLRLIERNRTTKLDITATYPQMLLNLKGTPPQVKQTVQRVFDELKKLHELSSQP